MYVHLLDITKQQCYIEWFVRGLYNYVHFPDTLSGHTRAYIDKEGFQARITVGSSNKLVVVSYIDIQQRQEQLSPLQGSCCPVWALQLLCTCTCMCVCALLARHLISGGQMCPFPENTCRQTIETQPQPDTCTYNCNCTLLINTKLLLLSVFHCPWQAKALDQKDQKNAAASSP